MKTLALISLLSLLPVVAQAIESETTCTYDRDYASCYTRTEDPPWQPPSAQEQLAQLQVNARTKEIRRQRWLDQCTIAWLRIGCPINREFNPATKWSDFKEVR